ncbi:helix-turn-helix domain-containing protein [Paenibacillus alba]|uniref:Helix-turn-helix transcriptional regulator n=1 Tax=Paenibacillus alba TaxID=1197127 RepID=A0ABU6GBE1_9BACL|nr:helix-turn-helix transcriptional regulator [Paenibacillus alba]MEC0231256.1 helix-turn-helix transcriptional regulator [Paenibacillus alba]
MNPAEFGIYIKNLRKSKKLTIRQLDIFSGVSHSYISQIERGVRGISSPDILEKLSKPLGVMYEELMKVAGYINAEEKDTPLTDEHEHILGLIPIEVMKELSFLPKERQEFIIEQLKSSVDISIRQLTNGNKKNK